MISHKRPARGSQGSHEQEGPAVQDEAVSFDVERLHNELSKWLRLPLFGRV